MTKCDKMSQKMLDLYSAQLIINNFIFANKNTPNNILLQKMKLKTHVVIQLFKRIKY